MYFQGSQTEAGGKLQRGEERKAELEIPMLRFVAKKPHTGTAAGSTAHNSQYEKRFLADAPTGSAGALFVYTHCAEKNKAHDHDDPSCGSFQFHINSFAGTDIYRFFGLAQPFLYSNFFGFSGFIGSGAVFFSAFGFFAGE